jgi:hypothetical protein
MPFLSGYTTRKKITVDNTYIDNNLTDFPLLVKIAADSDIGANIDSNGYNIRFTSNDGETLLKYERQSFSVSGGNATGIFWVKVPTLSGSADTDIYLYYKAASPSDGQDATNVWDSNFVAVYHLEQDPSGSVPQILDSTVNNNDGTSAGSMTSGDLVAAKVGYGLDFDGTDDYIDLGSGIAPTTAITVEIIVYLSNHDATNGEVLLDRAVDNPATKDSYQIYVQPDQTVRFTADESNGLINTCSAVSTGTVGSFWYHLAFTKDNSSLQGYYNGSPDGSDTASGPIGYAANNPTFIGRNGSSITQMR